MSLNKGLFLTAQIGYIAIVLCTLVLFPGAEVITTVMAMISVWLIVSLIYRTTPNQNMLGWWTLLIATSILAVGNIVNIHYFTELSGGTTAHPILNNPDAKGYFLDALHHSGECDGKKEYIDRRGYGFLISLLWKLTGITIVSPLILNMLMILSCIIISGIITSRISNTQQSISTKQLSSLAMIFTASVCYYLNSGTLLLKEAGVSLSMALIALGLTTINSTTDTSKSRIKHITYFLAGTILLCIMRYTYIPIVFIGTLLLISWKHKTEIKQGIPFLTICIIAWFAMALIFNIDTTDKAGGIVDGSTIQSAYFYDIDQHRYYNNLVGDYMNYPTWKRILMLPLSAATQFLVPFPWNFSRDMIYGYTLAYAHISYPWYIIGGMILFFIGFAWRTASFRLRLFTLVGIIMWLVPAYLFAGTVSRYALPMLPFLIPAAIYSITTYRHSKALKIGGIIYIILLICTLTICYHLQQSGINA